MPPEGKPETDTYTHEQFFSVSFLEVTYQVIQELSNEGVHFEMQILGHEDSHGRRIEQKNIIAARITGDTDPTHLWKRVSRIIGHACLIRRDIRDSFLYELMPDQ